MKHKISKGSVQETLLIPLYGRKMAMDLYPDLFADADCQSLFDSIDFEKPKMSPIKAKIGAIMAATRQYDILNSYRKLLEGWKERYAPRPDSDIWDLRFCEAMKALSTVDYLLDCLTIGTLEQRVAMVDSLLGSIIPDMQERLRKEDNAHGQADQPCA